MQTNNKLREACANIAEYARSAQCHTEDAHVLGYLNQIEGWAKAALAAPVRNCDVGVPEERIQRWSKFCKARSKKLPPIHGFEWEDYPYEEGGDK